MSADSLKADKLIRVAVLWGLIGVTGIVVADLMSIICSLKTPIGSFFMKH